MRCELEPFTGFIARVGEDDFSAARRDRFHLAIALALLDAETVEPKGVMRSPTREQQRAIDAALLARGIDRMVIERAARGKHTRRIRR